MAHRWTAVMFTEHRLPVLSTMKDADGSRSTIKVSSGSKDSRRQRLKKTQSDVLAALREAKTSPPGSRLNSAAAALNAAGHQVAAAPVIARPINPEYNQTTGDLLQSASAAPYRWEARPWLLT